MRQEDYPLLNTVSLGLEQVALFARRLDRLLYLCLRKIAGAAFLSS
jgi:hypothetical protein